MFPLSQFELIEEYDGEKILYEYQKDLIFDIEYEPHKIINLALLQTLGTIGRYDVAIEVLKYGIEVTSDIRACVIGFYLSVMWNGDLSCFEPKLEDSYFVASKEYQSITNLLFAMKYRNQHNFPLTKRYLEKSILLCDQYVNNHLMYAFYCSKNDRKKHLDSARNNLDYPQQNKEDYTSLEKITDPDNYIGEFITGNMMCIDTFESIVNTIK
ncbi:MAG: hypothetical protein ACLSVG_02755 [Clostridia bacterium]